MEPGSSDVQQLKSIPRRQPTPEGLLGVDSGEDEALEAGTAADGLLDGDYEDGEGLEDGESSTEGLNHAAQSAPAPAPLPGAAAPAPAPRTVDAAYEKRRFAQQHPELAASIFENIDELWLNVHDFRRNDEWWAENPHTVHDAETNATLAELGRCATLKCASRTALRCHPWRVSARCGE